MLLSRVMKPSFGSNDPMLVVVVGECDQLFFSRLPSGLSTEQAASVPPAQWASVPTATDPLCEPESPSLSRPSKAPDFQ